MTDDDERDTERCTDSEQMDELVDQVAGDVGLIADEAELGGGFRAVEAVQADGTVAFWLIDPAGPATGVWRPSNAPHELSGPLPREFKVACGLTCDGKNADGKPCRHLVRYRGDFCGHHARQGNQA